MNDDTDAATPTATMTFESHATRVIADFRDALERCLSGIPGDSRRSPTQLARRLSIDTKLAWKIVSCLDRQDPFEAGGYIPGRAAFRLFLKAARKGRWPETALSLLERREAAFDELVKMHAGSRRAFDTLLAAQRPNASCPTDLDHRKAAFKSAAYTWGLQARTAVKTYIIAPSASGNTFDAAVIQAFARVQRLRPATPWRLYSTCSIDDRGDMRHPDVEPLSGFDIDGVPLLERFCSQPRPSWNRVDSRDGQVGYQLSRGPVGITAAFDCVLGERVLNPEPRFRTEFYSDTVVHQKLRTPTEKLYFDFIVHPDTFADFRPKVNLFGDLFVGDYLDLNHLESDRLAIPDSTIQHIDDVEGLSCESLPCYREILDYAFARMDWRASDFTTLRVELDYPPLPAILFIVQPLAPETI